MQISENEKLIELLTEVRDVMQRHDRAVRPGVAAIIVLLVVLILVTYFR